MSAAEYADTASGKESLWKDRKLSAFFEEHRSEAGQSDPDYKESQLQCGCPVRPVQGTFIPWYPPYYIFQCRPATGNSDYAVPIEEGYGIFENARAQVSGPAKRARSFMSHMTGKIEVVGMDRKKIYMKYHRAADDADNSNFLVLKRNPNAYWLDDYDEIHSKNPLDNLYHPYGPE